MPSRVSASQTPSLIAKHPLSLQKIDGSIVEITPAELSVNSSQIQHFDALFGADKTYLGVSLEKLLEWSGDSAKVRILKFHCRDGYVSEVPLATLQKGDFLLATSDPEAAPDSFLPFQRMTYLQSEPKRLQKRVETLPEDSDDREKLNKKREQIETFAKDIKALKNQGPFYPIFKPSPELEKSQQWFPPFCVEKVSFWSQPTDRSSASPKGLANEHPAMRGSVTFGKRCGMCHAINGIGGEVGPDLNQPQSVSRYWKEEALRQMLKDPNQVRRNSKMPAFHLKDETIDDILAYLRWMDEHR